MQFSQLKQWEKGKETSDNRRRKKTKNVDIGSLGSKAHYDMMLRGVLVKKYVLSSQR